MFKQSRTGEFSFDPMGPATLKDLDQHQIIEEEQKTQPAEEPVPVVPESILQMLADENISMKEDLELKLNQIMEYKYIIQEYSDKLEAEISRNKLLSNAIDMIRQDKSIFSGASQNKMQELVHDLTLQLTEKVEELAALHSINR